MFNRLNKKDPYKMETKKFLQISFIFLLAIYGNIPHLTEKKLNAKVYTLKEIVNYLQLRNSVWNRENEKQYTSVFSNIILGPLQEENIFGHKTLIKEKIFDQLLSDVENTNNKLKITHNFNEMNISQKTPILNIFRENKNHSQTNLCKMTHSGVNELNSKLAPEENNNVWYNTPQLENCFKDFNKAILNSFTHVDKGEPSIYKIKPTKSTIFQYFSSNQSPILNYFHSDYEFSSIEDDSTLSENNDLSENSECFQRDHLFHALKANSNFETLAETLDQRVMASSIAVLLEGSFTDLESVTNSKGKQDKSINFQFSSSDNNQNPTRSGRTPGISINEDSEHSDSISESPSEIDDSTDSQIFMSSCYVHSSGPSMDTTFTSICRSLSIYSTSPALEYGVSSMYSSSNTVDDIS